MGILGRDAILKASDIKTETVDVPEWGGSVLVRGMTGAERDKFESSMVEIRGKKRIFKPENVRAWLVRFTAVDEDGNNLFADRDVPALANKSGAALDRVAGVAQKLSGLTDEDVEELAKN